MIVVVYANGRSRPRVVFIVFSVKTGSCESSSLVYVRVVWFVIRGGTLKKIPRSQMEKPEKEIAHDLAAVNFLES